MKEKLLYITSSSVSELSANSIHVINMIDAFQKKNFYFYSYVLSKNFLNNNQNSNIKKLYGMDIKKKILKTYFYPFERGKSLYLILRIFIDVILKIIIGYKVYTRNIHAATMLAILFPNKIFFEAHDMGFGKSVHMFKFLSFVGVNFITISEALKIKIIARYKVNKKLITTIPDASSPLKFFKKYKNETNTFINKKFKGKRDFIFGYFGTVQKGRGVEMICEIASKLKNVKLLIVGDSKQFRGIKKKNVINIGLVDYPIARNIMEKCDALIMPYTTNTMVNSRKVNTAQIMSPLKMFEYMSTKKPILASKLKVLEEVLNNKNAILIEEQNYILWRKSMRNILKNYKLQKRISEKAFQDFTQKYTWDIRINKIIQNMKM